MGFNEVKTLLSELTGENNISINVPMSGHTSFKAGGNADLMVVPQDADELKEILKALSDSGYPYMILGNGSNVLVRDGGYHGVMVKMGEGFADVKV